MNSQTHINKKVNILFIAHDNSLSGASLSLLSLLSGINREAFRPYVIVPLDGELKDEIERLNIPVYVKLMKHWIPFTNQWGLKDFIDLVLTLKARVWAISHLIENNQIDIVYTNTVTIIDGAISAYITKTPHIWHAREYIKGNKDIKPYIPSIFIPLIMHRLSDQIIVNSDSLKRFIKSKLSKCYVTTIYNGVDLNKFTHKNSNLGNIKQQNNISSSTKLVSYVGTLCERKDLLTFIRAAKLIKDAITDVAFIIVGDGNKSYINKIIELVDILNLTPDVFILGSRNDIPDIMNATDVLVLTSEQEAFGKVIIEAMAASRPVIATKSGGPEEIVIDGETGFLVPLKNAKAIAEKVVFLLTNPKQANHMGQKGFIRAQSLYSMEKYVQSIENVIANTMKKNGTIG